LGTTGTTKPGLPAGRALLVAVGVLDCCVVEETGECGDSSSEGAAEVDGVSMFVDCSTVLKAREGVSAAVRGSSCWFSSSSAVVSFLVGNSTGAFGDCGAGRLLRDLFALLGNSSSGQENHGT
jgi:hypothetical protein